MKAPFYIIPSSVHEIIIVPKTLNMTLSEIRQMVRLVNKEAVSKEPFRRKISYRIMSTAMTAKRKKSE